MTDASARPRLAPGLRIVRRGLDHLQVGLYDGRRVLLPRTEVVERTLSLVLERQVPPEDRAVTAVLDRLAEQGCLGWGPTPGTAGGSVAVLGSVGPARGLLTDLLAAGGLRLAGSVDEADVVLVADVGETDRDLLDPLVRSRTSHVLLRLVDGGALVGPFVVPGVTACLRCIDAHRSVTDPAHVAVTTRYVRATHRPRADGEADVVDPALAALAVAVAVRDVAAHLSGGEPATWSRTLHWGADPKMRREDVWLRHPACGCSWSADLWPQDELGA